MFEVPLGRIAGGWRRDEEVSLRVRIFRLVCAAVAVLSLGLVLPANLLQNLPPVVNLSTVLLGLLGAYCYWESCRDRHFFTAFLLISVAMLDVAWFWNAGSQGSVTYYFFPALFFSQALFRGRARWLLAAGLAANVAVLFLLERAFPGWITPFHRGADRLLDHISGIVCSFSSMAAVGGLVFVSHDREQERIRQIAARLATSEQTYREIFNSTGDALFIHDLTGRVVDINERACALFGFDRPTGLALTGNAGSLGISPYSTVEAMEKIQQTLAGVPQVFRWRSRRHDGTLFWSEVALRACEIAGQQRVIAAVRDLSDRLQAEETIRASEERLRLAMTASAQGWFEMNVQTGLGVSSPEYLHIIEQDPATYRTTLQNWIDGIHPEDRDRVIQVYRECLAAGDTRTLEYRRMTKAGTWKWIRSVGRIVERDAAGKPLRMCGTHADITERKELEAQLLHSQRLEAVGTLASGVAHDLNNILAPMLMASGTLRENLPDPGDRELMAMIDSGAKRGAAIVKQLLAFSRSMTENRVPVDPRQVRRETVQMMQSTLPKNIAIVEPAVGEVGCILAEPTQLQQVLVNLCVNARDAMPSGGMLTLGIERVELPPADLAREGAPKTGPYLVFSVTDTGLGIAPENLERIFDPFFTTKDVGKGTGLGLASVHGIAKAHGGFVRVDSAPGRGATFRVFLPAMSAPPVPAPAAPTPPAPPPTGGGERILVIDDDGTVLAVTRRILERAGYRVLAASSGEEALRLLREAAGGVRLAVTDFAMPEMDGPTLAPLMRAVAPSLRIIGVSGHDHGARSAELADLGFAEILRKPYESADLLASIRLQLQESAGRNAPEPA